MFLNNKFSLWLLLFLSVIIYFLIGFYIIREEFFILIISFIFLFIFQLYFLNQRINLISIFILGIVFRLSLIISIPELSQDFSRFIWDGSIQILGVNPYLYKPETLINLVHFPLSDFLYSKMGNLSAMNFSNYPPISQYIYYMSGYFNNGEIIIFIKFKMICKQNIHINFHVSLPRFLLVGYVKQITYGTSLLNAVCGGKSGL